MKTNLVAEGNNLLSCNLYKELQELAVKEGITLFGVCSVKRIVEFIHPSIRELARDLSYGISLGYRLSDSVLSTIDGAPSLIYKHHYKTVNWLLDQCAEKLANLIQAKGYRSLAIPASQTVNWEQQEGHLSHILVAKECGLGWIGRSGLLVHPKYGARVRYATVLTDLELENDNGTDTTKEYGCGDCHKCIDACPAGAISKNGYNKEKCVEQLKKFAAIRGVGVYICGVCVKVCDGKRDGN